MSVFQLYDFKQYEYKVKGMTKTKDGEGPSSGPPSGPLSSGVVDEDGRRDSIPTHATSMHSSSDVSPHDEEEEEGEEVYGNAEEARQKRPDIDDRMIAAEYLALMQSTTIKRITNDFQHLFREQYGDEFLCNFEENLLNLPREGFEFLDAFNQQHAEQELLVHMESIEQDIFPTIVQPAPSSYEFVHANGVQFPKIVFANTAFREVFGWDGEKIDTHGVSCSLLIPRRKVIPIARAAHEALVNAPDDWRVPLFYEIRDHELMAHDGTFKKCQGHVCIIRSPTLVPVYYIARYLPPVGQEWFGI